MRRVIRRALPPPTQGALDRRQQKADQKRTAAGTLNVQSTWNSARKTKPLATVFKTLKEMAGERERCMYCGDSHGTDIEHFWPKTPYPERMFRWPNMLLCCTECGRFKGERFPLDANGLPLLVDPSAANPWDFLDFNPDTYNFVARFDLATNAPSAHGATTVDLLQLDRREALEAGYRKTHKRILALAERAAHQDTVDIDDLLAQLSESDDHGLLGWYFSGTGRNLKPFSTLRARHPAAWAACVTAFT
jgi:uncharacterized protein (TIGR02646 family)